MQVKEFLVNTITKLSPENGTPELDAEVLLAHALGVDRSWLHAHPEHEIPEDNLKILSEHVERRAKHEPIAYILGKTEFYGRKFYITNGVLVPRPESETMIDLCKQYCSAKNIEDIYLIDVGTGSGALVISAVLETNTKYALAIDIDDKCLEVAKKNIDEYKLRIELLKSNLLETLLNTNLVKKHLVILANLPYVPEKYSINTAAKNEPAHAIFGGEDGLELYRKMFGQLDKISAESTVIFTESLPFQHKALAKLASAHGFKLGTEEDFIQVFKR